MAKKKSWQVAIGDICWQKECHLQLWQQIHQQNLELSMEQNAHLLDFIHSHNFVKARESLAVETCRKKEEVSELLIQIVHFLMWCSFICLDWKQQIQEIARAHLLNLSSGEEDSCDNTWCKKCASESETIHCDASIFSLTGHKTQGQTMDSIVIHLPDDSIERARIPGSWLYVQFSCVKKLNDLFFDVSINTSRSEILQTKHKCKPMNRIESHHWNNQHHNLFSNLASSSHFQQTKRRDDHEKEQDEAPPTKNTQQHWNINNIITKKQQQKEKESKKKIDLGCDFKEFNWVPLKG